MMTRRYLFTFLSTVVLLGIYSVYAQISRQLLSYERTVHQSVVPPNLKTAQVPGPKISHEMALQYLTDAPWAVDARVKIRANGFHLFFNEHIQENSNTEIRLSPIAMIWNLDRTPNEQGEPREPIVILADSATIQFDQTIELSEIRTELIRQMILRGQVTIRGADDLHVTGSNFTFSRASKHIFSDHPVEFQMQNHHGIARNITLNLEMLDGGIHKNNPQILGITEMFTREYLELTLQQNPKDPPAIVTCHERFSFRVPEQQAILTGKVQLLQTDPEGFQDKMNCDQLTLQFMKAKEETALRTETPSEPNAPEASPADNPSLLSQSKMTLHTIKAEGKMVRCTSQKHQFIAIGQELNVDLPQRVLVMQQLNKTEMIRLNFQGTDLLTPRLEVHVDELNQPVFAHCQGPGQLSCVDPNPDSNKVAGASSEANSVLAYAKWRDSLTFAQDPEGNKELSVVTLMGSAYLRSPQHQAGMLSKKLRLWLHRAPETLPAAKDENPSASLSDSENLKQLAQGISIRKALAEGEVTVDSPHLAGKYDTIQVDFREDAAKVLEALARTQLAQSRPPQADPASPIKQVSGTESPQPVGSSGDSAPSTENAAKPQMQIQARHLELTVLHDESFENVHLAHVHSQGEMTAIGTIPDQKDEITIHGQSAEIFNEGGAEQRFQLLGSGERFAWVQNGSLRIDGINLAVDRGKNTARVRGSGSLQLPVDEDWEGMPLGQTSLMTVSWTEVMSFNGSSVHFIGRVRAKIGDSVITCEELTITLEEPISLQKRHDQNVKPQLAQVRCRDRVHFEMNHYEEGKLMGVRSVNVSSFEFDYRSGNMAGQGPGWMEFWQRRTGKSPLGLPEATMSQDASQKKAAANPKQEGWDYTRVSFEGNMSGNFHRKQATLHHQINILHGPVSRPLISFERDARPEESVWMRCEELEIYVKELAPAQVKEEEAKTSLEVLAKHNAEIEGDQFLVRSDQLSYDGSNKLFVIRSLENRQATIWHYESSQSLRTRYDFKMLRLSPNGNILELDRVGSVSGSGAGPR